MPGLERKITRRVFMGGGVMAATAAMIDTRWGEHRRVVQYRKSLHGDAAIPLRVAFLSDFHIADPWMPLSTLEAVVSETNALCPDLVLLGGDVSGWNLPGAEVVGIEPIARCLATLRAPLGVFAVPGNHDWLADRLLGGSWNGQLAVERGFAAHGIRMLRNAAVPLTQGGRPFWLAGLESDPFYHGKSDLKDFPDLEKALAPAMGDDFPLILLAHEPDIFARHHPRVDLQLSGHMHAGQVRLGPWIPGQLPSRYGRRYLHGLIEEEGRPLVVSGGLGYSRLPVRIGAAPEIVFLDLRV